VLQHGYQIEYHFRVFHDENGESTHVFDVQSYGGEFLMECIAKQIKLLKG